MSEKESTEDLIRQYDEDVAEMDADWNRMEEKFDKERHRIYPPEQEIFDRESKKGI